MKKLLFILYLSSAALSSSAVTSRNINDKIVRNFKETYPNAIQVSWMEYPETYAVYFVQDGIKVNIIFNKDGSFVSSVRYYKEDFLPYYLLDDIRKKYSSKKVYSVSELTTPGTITYFIKLEDARTWLTIKMDSEGNMNVVEKLNKQS
jgi:hypothetical protein